MADSLSGGQIAGIIVGVIVGILLIVFIVSFAGKRKQRTAGDSYVNFGGVRVKSTDWSREMAIRR